jgi:hypothetical protein
VTGDSHLTILAACFQTIVSSIVGFESLSLISENGIPWRTMPMMIMT